MRNKIIRMNAIALLLLANTAFAAYFPSDTIIENNADAWTKCPEVCTNNMQNWTGSWWTTADPTSVCECFHGWPYCPQMYDPPTNPGCIPPT